MNEKGAVALLLILYGAFLIFGLHQSLTNLELKQQNALQKEQIEELQKKVRLTAQDVGFIEKLVTEGKQ